MGGLYFCTDTQEIIHNGISYSGKSEQYILYSVEIADTNYGDVTLSDDLANYSYIEIFAATDDKHLIYQKVCNPNGQKVALSAALIGAGNYFFMKCKVVQCSGTSITTAKYSSTSMQGLYNATADTVTNSGDYIGIYRVVGYK